MSGAPSAFDWEVIAAAPRWSLNGVNVFSERLVRGLRARGVAANLLLTGSGEGDPKPLPLPACVPIQRLETSRARTQRARWELMVEHLRERAPCIYLPNNDYAYSCVAPALPADVGVVGIAHSDDPQHYAHARHLGRYWNAAVAVSGAIDAELRAQLPGLAARLHVIPYGVERRALPERPTRHGDAPLRVLYVGRLVQHQKRVLDLPRIAAGLAQRDVPVEWTVIGGGADREALEAAARPWTEAGTMRFAGILPTAAVQDEMRRHDVLVLVSAFEGLPITVLEAMSHGCVPVVTGIRSGIPELVRDGDNGFVRTVGDIEGFVDRLAALQRDGELLDRLGRRAADTIRAGFSVDHMVDRYVDLFRGVAKQIEDGAFARPAGGVEQLPWMRPRLRDRLPPSLRRALARARSVLT